jgi:hypothetical protein
MRRALAHVELACPCRDLVPVRSDCVDWKGKNDPEDRRGCNASRARGKPYRQLGAKPAREEISSCY